jgi:hypothetical protein
VKIKAECLVLLVAFVVYGVLESYLFDSQYVFALLSPGVQGIGVYLYFASFVFLRLFLLLLVPAYFIFRLSSFLWFRKLKNQDEDSTG